MPLPGWRRRLHNSAQKHYTQGWQDAARGAMRNPGVYGEAGCPHWVHACWRLAYDAGFDAGALATHGGRSTTYRPELDAHTWAALLAERQRP